MEFFEIKLTLSMFKFYFYQVFNSIFFWTCVQDSRPWFLLSYKKLNWFYFLYWRSSGSPQTIAVFSRRNNCIKKGPWHGCCPVNFAKFSRTPILWNTCKRLLLYIGRLISTWRKVFFYYIYCSFIWFNYIRITNKENFNTFKNSKSNCLWYYLLLVASKVITILLPLRTISVTKMYLAFLFWI